MLIPEILVRAASVKFSEYRNVQHVNCELLLDHAAQLLAARLVDGNVEPYLLERELNVGCRVDVICP
jgi:hypothetical protein